MSDMGMIRAGQRKMESDRGTYKQEQNAVVAGDTDKPAEMKQHLGGEVDQTVPGAHAAAMQAHAHAMRAHMSYLNKQGGQFNAAKQGVVSGETDLGGEMKTHLGGERDLTAP